ncbi:MAG: amidase [Solirubrobacterales bacterium]
MRNESPETALARWLRATVAGEPAPDWAGWPPRYDDSPEPAAARLRPRSAPATIAGGGPYVDLEHGLGPAPAAREGAPLAGFTFAVKNMIAVAGVPSRLGSASAEDAAPEPADAPAVAALRAAGARYVGATGMHEVAFGLTGINHHDGTALNPWDPERLPGGSSSGSAVAVAEGSARVALGTDTGGSVRVPASLCGVAGFKPARGSYPIDGVFPLSPTLDHVGTFAAGVEDLIALHGVLAGEAVAPASAPPALAFDPAHLGQASAGARRALELARQRLAGAGAEPIAVEIPPPARAFAVSTSILLPEAARVHERTLREHPERFGEDVRARLEDGAALPPDLYEEALAARTELRLATERALAGGLVAIGPAVGEVAPRLEAAGDATIAARMAAHTRLGNVTGLPALSLPLPADGLPIGLQLVGLTDAAVLAAAAWIERTLAAPGG